MALTTGDRLGSYEVTALIGQGGMGEVYRARDTKLGRDVALKVLPDVFADEVLMQTRLMTQRRSPVVSAMERYDLFLGSGISIDTSLRYWRYLSPKYPMRSRSSN